MPSSNTAVKTELTRGRHGVYLYISPQITGSCPNIPIVNRIFDNLSIFDLIYVIVRLIFLCHNALLLEFNLESYGLTDCYFLSNLRDIS